MNKIKSFTFILIFTICFAFLQSCAKSGSSGTTGGNPLESSLPNSISLNVQ